MIMYRLERKWVDMPPTSIELHMAARCAHSWILVNLANAEHTAAAVSMAVVGVWRASMESW